MDIGQWLEINAGRQQRFQEDLPKEWLNTFMGGSAGQREAELGAKALANKSARWTEGQELTTSLRV
jgi:hypothetical protein